jgi:hypothetical protein
MRNWEPARRVGVRRTIADLKAGSQKLVAMLRKKRTYLLALLALRPEPYALCLLVTCSPVFCD